MGRFRAMGVVGLLLLGLTGCSLVGVPGLFLNAKSIYTSSPVVIPYTFDGPTNTEWCRYTLDKLQPGPTPYVQIGRPMVRSLGSSGYLVIDVAAMSGTSVVDGNYILTFGVLGSSGDQGTIPTLTQTAQFSVQTGPYIQTSSPLVINTGSLPVSMTLQGWDFGSSAGVTALPDGAGSLTIAAGSVSTSSAGTQITLTVSTANPPGAYLVASNGSATSPQYLVPVVAGAISFAATNPVVPNFGNVTDTALQVVIQGTGFTPYTTISFLDANGNPVPFTVTGSSSTYFTLSVDLSHSTAGPGAITLFSNDSLGTVTGSASFYIGG